MSLPSSSLRRELRRSSSASMPTELRTVLMSSAEGEVLPARPRRRKAARYFILTVSGRKALVELWCGRRGAGRRQRQRGTHCWVVWLETGESITFKRKRRLNLRVLDGWVVVGNSLRQTSRIGRGRPWPALLALPAMRRVCRVRAVCRAGGAPETARASVLGGRLE